MPTHIVLVPGFMASQIRFTQPPRFRQSILAWIDLDGVLGGNDRYLPFTEDGLTPEVQAPYPLALGALADGTYNRLRHHLEVTYPKVTTWAHDWRLRSTSNAADLAAFLQTIISQGDEPAIVAHSRGGLVAAGAYTLLKNAGQSAAIKRVVTLGTPFLGSFGSVAGVKGMDWIATLLSYGLAGAQLYRELPLLTALWVLFPTLAVSRAARTLVQAKRQVQRMLRHWPGFLDLLPANDALLQAGPFEDPNHFYQSTWWANQQNATDPALPQGLLTQASIDRAQWRLSTLTPPQRDQWVCMAFNGMSTVSRLKAGQSASERDSYYWTVHGDGRVETIRATPFGIPDQYFWGEHSSALDEPDLLPLVDLAISGGPSAMPGGHVGPVTQPLLASSGQAAPALTLAQAPPITFGTSSRARNPRPAYCP